MLILFLSIFKLYYKEMKAIMIRLRNVEIPVPVDLYIFFFIA